MSIINLHLPETIIVKPSITVFGVGGAGGNAVNNMITCNLEGVNFVVANTDAQILEFSKASKVLQLGAKLTSGLGAGASPETGRAAAEEAADHIMDALKGSNMVFITAGMGGGTGTGAAPVIARIAKQENILTVAVVTKPFLFEGAHRMRLAERGLEELQDCVDTLIVIPNQNLFRIANEKTTFQDAFKKADDVLYDGVRSITDLMIMPGLINLDFADIRSVMKDMRKAMMGTGEAEGEKRAIVAAEAAISNPLLDHSSMKGARGVLINITGGSDMTLFEVDEAANRVREEVDPDANIIFGSAFNQNLDGKIRVSVVATGIDSESIIPKKLSVPIQDNFSNRKDHYVREETIINKPEQSYVVKEENYNTEFAKKNIPTYPNVSSTSINVHKNSHNFEKDLSEKKDLFYASETIEPKSFVNSTVSYKPEIKNNNEPVVEKTSLGLFGRMANSVRFKSAEKQIEREDHDNFKSFNQEREKEDAMMSDDIFNIPAFQRRKK